MCLFICKFSFLPFHKWLKYKPVGTQEPPHMRGGSEVRIFGIQEPSSILMLSYFLHFFSRCRLLFLVLPFLILLIFLFPLSLISKICLPTLHHSIPAFRSLRCCLPLEILIQRSKCGQALRFCILSVVSSCHISFKRKPGIH